MPRQQRLDFPDAIQYVRLRGRQNMSIFFDRAILLTPGKSPRCRAAGVRRFETLLATTCDECATTLLAYSIEPNEASIVLQLTGAPLAETMRRLSGQYSRGLELPTGPVVFASRYVSQVISPEYLAYAVRRAHRRPVEAGLCRRPIDYPFSSERAYLGEPSILPMNFRPVRTALQQKGYIGLRGYREFMNQPDTPYLAKLFAQGSPQDARIVGAKPFVQQVRYQAAHPPQVPTRDQLIARVTRLLQITDADLYAATRLGVLGRALVAWYGLRSGAATLNEMARWFSITGATLGQAMHHHRRKAPQWFQSSDSPFEKDEGTSVNQP
jgi:putative transposase